MAIAIKLAEQKSLGTAGVDEPLSEKLSRKFQVCGLKLLACLEQLCQFIGGILDVTNRDSMFLITQHNYGREFLILSTTAGIRKITKQRTAWKTVRLGQMYLGNEPQMEGFPICTIEDRNGFIAEKANSAMCALLRISLQGAPALRGRENSV